MSKEGFVGGIGDYTQYLLSDPDETFATSVSIEVFYIKCDKCQIHHGCTNFKEVVKPIIYIT